MTSPVLAEARKIAARSNLVVVPKRSASGGVRNYKVFRKMPDRLVFLGEKVDETALLALVKRLAA